MKKVLIVDDEKKMRGIHKKFLSKENFKVLEAENGEQAGLLLIQEKDIDLVLLDIRMPVVSGADGFFDKSEGTDILLTRIKRIMSDDPK